ncbi:MAG: GxxExxY protein [Bacteroidota bacterium]|nr:GxxExxY protein [Bacteroidota bacterium]
MENNTKVEHKEISLEDNRIGREIVDVALKVHRTFGPGLLEKVYEFCMEFELKKRGFKVERQMCIPITYESEIFTEALKLDMIVNNRVIIELKSTEKHNKIWEAQILSYLKLTNLNLGYLINFNVPLIKLGIQRFINS